MKKSVFLFLLLLHSISNAFTIDISNCYYKSISIYADTYGNTTTYIFNEIGYRNIYYMYISTSITSNAVVSLNNYYSGISTTVFTDYINYKNYIEFLINFKLKRNTLFFKTQNASPGQKFNIYILYK